MAGPNKQRRKTARRKERQRLAAIEREKKAAHPVGPFNLKGRELVELLLRDAAKR